MAAITILSFELVVHNNAQHGYRELRGCGQFNGTDSTGTLQCPGLTILDGAFFNGEASDEQPYLNETLNAGKFTLPDSRNITVGRSDNAPSSGLIFFFRITGR